MKYKFALAGGDLRNVKLAALFEEDGHDVYTYALDSSSGRFYHRCNSMSEAFGRGHVIVGPMPFTIDGTILNAPLHSADIELDDLLLSVPEGRLLIAGRIPSAFKEKAQKKGIVTVDLLEREDMAMLNTIPTAEGAVQIAMEELPVTIHGLRVMVLGLGKVGGTLADMLKALGADVTVAIRKSRDAAKAMVKGLKHCGFEDLTEAVTESELIYNTVPAKVIGPEILDQVGKKTLIIDLASAPGGVDFEYAAKKEVKAIQALSLPGKVAPVSAAQNMARVIYNIIHESGFGGMENA